MTYSHNGKLIIQEESAAECESCGELGELRPYGPGGTKICHPCAMKDLPAVTRRFLDRLSLAGGECVSGNPELN